MFRQSPEKRRKFNESDFYQSDSSSASDDDWSSNENSCHSPTDANSSWSSWRSKVRSNSQFSTMVRVSQQSCKLENNRKVLLGWRSSTKDGRLIGRLNGLLAVLETLLLPSTYALREFVNIEGEPFGKKFGGLLEFKIAFEIYEDHARLERNKNARVDTMSSQFLLDLLNDKYGIRCVILTLGQMRYIILDSDFIDMPSILSQIADEFYTSKKEQRKEIPYQFIRDGLAVMDSEFDKNICSSILSLLLVHGDLITCGINATQAKTKQSRMVAVLQELEEVTVLSEQAVAARISERMRKLEDKLKVLGQKKSRIYTTKRRNEIEDKIQSVKDQITSEGEVLARESKNSKQKFKQRVKRMSARLIKERRLKNRKAGAGAKPLLDFEDEEFIAKAIESKGSAHGRRHDATVYLNHRLKCQDLLSFVNYNLARRGKQKIKSVRTVMLRSKPKRCNTREAKRHKGKTKTLIVSLPYKLFNIY